MRSAIKYTAIVTAAFFFGALVMMSGSSNATTTAGKTRTVTRSPAACVTAITSFNKVIHMESQGGQMAAKGAIHSDVYEVNAATAIIVRALHVYKQAAPSALSCVRQAQ